MKILVITIQHRARTLNGYCQTAVATVPYFGEDIDFGALLLIGQKIVRVASKNICKRM